MQRKRKLTRSPNRIIVGVLGGLADYFGIDATLVRILFAGLSTFPGHLIAGVLVYLVLMVVIPDDATNRPRSSGTKPTEGGRKTLHDVTEEDHREDNH